MADDTFTHLVVVKSSAGGIGALSGMVSSLPEDFDAPIVVAQHLDPNRKSHLQEILALQSERSRLEALLVNIPDAVLAVDAAGQLLFSNQVFEEPFGEHDGTKHGMLGSAEVLDEGGETLPPEEPPPLRAARGESFAMQFAISGRTEPGDASRPR